MNHTLTLVLLMSALQASATADGPDFYAVKGVKNNDVLNLRSGPGPQFNVLAKIPPQTSSLENLVECAYQISCKKVSSDVRTDAGPVWCRVKFEASEGWVAAAFLTEGARSPTESTFNSNSPQASLDILAISTLQEGNLRHRLILARDEIYPTIVLETIVSGETEGDRERIRQHHRLSHLILDGVKVDLTTEGLLMSNLQSVDGKFEFDLRYISKQVKQYSCVVRVDSLPEVKCKRS